MLNITIFYTIYRESKTDNFFVKYVNPLDTGGVMNCYCIDTTFSAIKYAIGEAFRWYPRGQFNFRCKEYDDIVCTKKEYQRIKLLVK